MIYLEVLDAVADCKDTMMTLLHSLRSRFFEERNMRWLVLEGDAKLYEILKHLTFEYGDELSWLIPFPDDFHMLMNYKSFLYRYSFLVKDIYIKMMVHTVAAPGGFLGFLETSQDSGSTDQIVKTDGPFPAAVTVNKTPYKLLPRTKSIITAYKESNYVMRCLTFW